MLIIDSHTHVFNKMCGWRYGNTKLEPLEYGKARLEDDIIQWVPPCFKDTTVTSEILLNYMDWVGIDKAVLLQAPCYGDQNKYVFEIIKENPNRFVGVGLVDPRKKGPAAEEIEYLINNYNFKGIKFEVPDVPFYMDLEEYNCIWEKIINLNIFAVIDLGWGFGPYDYNIERLINVLKKYPTLKVILPHLGVSKLPDQNQKYPFPFLQKTLKLSEKFPNNVWFDIAALPFFCEKEEYPYPRAQEILKIVKNNVDLKKILWGSDFPTVLTRCTYQQSIDLIMKNCDFFSEEEKFMIMGKNALELYFG